MTDRELIKAELQNLQKILEAKADMCVGNGKVKLLSFANACSGALELLKEQETMMACLKGKCRVCPHCRDCDVDDNGKLIEREPVKRCKDCKYYNTHGCDKGFGWCERNGAGCAKADEWFCEAWEKKGE